MNMLDTHLLKAEAMLVVGLLAARAGDGQPWCLDATQTIEHLQHHGQGRQKIDRKVRIRRDKSTGQSMSLVS